MVVDDALLPFAESGAAVEGEAEVAAAGADAAGDCEDVVVTETGGVATGGAVGVASAALTEEAASTAITSTNTSGRMQTPGERERESIQHQRRTQPFCPGWFGRGPAAVIRPGGWLTRRIAAVV